MSRTISRRTFLKGAAVVGVSLTAGGCLPWNGNNIPEKVKNDEVIYDVLVIGSGGAGMRAALAAAEDKKLKVAVMTKLMPTRSASTMAQGGMNYEDGRNPKSLEKLIKKLGAKPVAFSESRKCCGFHA